MINPNNKIIINITINITYNKLIFYSYSSLSSISSSNRLSDIGIVPLPFNQNLLKSTISSPIKNLNNIKKTKKNKIFNIQNEKDPRSPLKSRNDFLILQKNNYIIN